jgi:hypothetical protein
MDTQTPEARRMRSDAGCDECPGSRLSVGAILAAAALASISTNDIPEFVNYASATSASTTSSGAGHEWRIGGRPDHFGGSLR